MSLFGISNKTTKNPAPKQEAREAAALTDDMMNMVSGGTDEGEGEDPDYADFDFTGDGVKGGGMRY